MVAKEEDSILIQESLCYNICKDLCTNNNNIETLAIKIENKRSRNIVLNVICRHPNKDLKVSEKYFNDFFSKNEKNEKKIKLVGEFNVNVLDLKIIKR